MKKSKRFLSLLCALLCGAAIISSASAGVAFAGTSERKNIEAKSFSEGIINTGVWNQKGVVNAVNNMLVFDNSCTGEDYLTAKSKFNDNSYWGVDLFISVESALTINGIDKNARFAYSIGLPERKSAIGENGSYELVFQDKVGALAVGFGKYSNGTFIEISEIKTRTGIEYGKEIRFSVSVWYDKTVSVTVNDNVLCDKKSIISIPDGFFALGQSGGKTNTAVSDLTVSSVQYDAPENGGDIFEDFDNGEYNANVWYSKSEMGAFTPTGLFIENGALKFQNTGSAYFVTRHQYSNFELTFDLFDYQNEAKYDDNGNFLGGISASVGIYFGGPKIKEVLSESIRFTNHYFIMSGADESTDTTVNPNGVYGLLYTNRNWYASKSMAASGVDLWDRDLSWDASAGRNKTINVKAVVKDMQASFYVKYADKNEKGQDIPAQDASWGEPVLSYKLSETPTGHIRIGSYSPGQVSGKGVKYTIAGNFSIDNVMIKNLDKDDLKQVIDIDYKSNVIEYAKDYEYTDNDEPSDLLSSKLSGKEKESSGCAASSSLSVPVFAIIGAVVAVLGRKKKS